MSKAQLHDSPVVSLSDLWPEGQIQTLSGRIIDHIRSSLFSGHLTSGAFLGTEASWAEQFGVSRMVSRDAINALKAAGIIEIRIGARGGIFVAEANPDRFAEALAIQMKLIGVEHAEVLDAQIAACNLGLKRLEELFQKYGEATVTECIERVFAESEAHCRQVISKSSRRW